MKQLLTRAFTFLATYWPEISVSILCAGIAIANYAPGTWLVGWDNLLPEVDVWLNLRRTLFSAWQENQGLGLVGGIGHAADLSRQLILLPFILTLPANVIRYLWTFAMLTLGPLGVLQLGKLVAKNWSITKQQRNLALVLGGLFYVLNIATVQNFFVPLETFASFYGFFPWMLWSAVQYLHTNKQRYLVYYLMIHILGASAFHVQTLFVVYSLVLAIFMCATILRDKTRGLVRAVTIGVSTILVHLFWLLPVLYFTLTNADMTVLSKQNLFSTPEAQLMNQSYGTISDILSLKGYWFEYTDYSDSKTVYLLQAWREHFGLPLTNSLSYVVPALSIVGFFAFITKTFKQKKKLDLIQVSFLLTAALSFEMLTAGNGAIGLPFKLLANTVPLFGQMFRVAFTKWSIVFALFITVGLIHFFGMIFEVFKKRLKELPIVVAFLISCTIVWTVHPMFSGGLIYNKMRLQIPDEYFDLFRFFKSQPKQARILHLPAETMWGWSFYSWDYRGSGFLWYGIEQPIVDRNFDVWSAYNESLYTELLHAIQTTDTTRFIKLINKYDISYILIDRNKISPSLDAQNQGFDSVDAILNDLDLQPMWHSQNLYVYKTGNRQKSESFVEAPPSYTNILNVSRNTTSDIAFSQHGSYATLTNNQQQSKYPFTYLTEHSPSQNILVGTTNVTFTPKQDIDIQNRDTVVQLPKMSEDVSIAPIGTVTQSESSVQISFEPLVLLTTEHTTTAVGQIPTISIPIQSDQLQKIYVLVNNQVINLDKRTSIRMVFETIEIGKPITVGYVQSEYVTIDDAGVITIDASKVASTFISESFWNDFYAERSINIPNDEVNSLRIVAPIVDQNQQLSQLKNSTLQNCDVFKRGLVTKEFGQAGVHYNATSYASGCDGTFLQGVSSKKPFLLQLKQSAQTGRPMRMYLEHHKSNIVLYEEIVPTNTSWMALDALPLADSPYYLGLENKSFGQASVNYITDFMTVPLPISTQWVAGIQILSDSTPSVAKMNVIQPTVVKKIGTHFYSIAINPNHTGGLITLSQSFDNGWIAFTNRGLLTSASHIKVNNWKNGWIVPADTDHLYIFFYPQIGIFLGIICIPLLYIFLKPNRKT